MGGPVVVVPSGPARAVASLLVATLLLPSVVGLLARPAAPPPTGATFRPELDPSSVGVAVDPATWSMFPGASKAFSANASGLSDGCSVFAAWYDWSLPPASFDKGYLNSSSGPDIELTAFANATGTIDLNVSALFALTCPDGSSFDVEPQGSVTVRILPALRLGPLTLSPDPATPGAPVTVGWNLSGGAGPYAVDVDFGDGNTTRITQATEGNGSVQHRYSAGQFDPVVEVVDSRGTAANASDPTSLLCAPGVAATLEAPAGGLEAGRTGPITAIVRGGYGPLRTAWSVSGGPNRSAPSADGLTLNLTPGAPGSLQVTFQLRDALGENATAAAVVDVAAPPASSLDVPSLPLEVGAPTLVNGSVQGGVGPYVVQWSVPTGNGSGELNLSGPGTFRLPLRPTDPGSYLVRLDVRDAEGGTAESTVDLGPVAAAPQIAPMLPAAPPEVGRPTSIAFELTGGVGPFGWTVESGSGISEPNGSQGTARGDGTVNWSCVPWVAGNLSIRVFLEDGRDGFADANLTVPVAEALGLSVRFVAPATVENLTVLATVTGGVAPFSVALVADGRSTNLSLPSADGPIRLVLGGTAVGNATALVALRDATGAVRIWVAPVAIGASGAPEGPDGGGPFPTGPGSWIAGGGLLLGIAVAGGAGARWVVGRAPRRPRAARALSQVQRAVQEADGIDAETLEFLGEAEGLRFEEIRTAVEQWIALGRIDRTEDGTGSVQLRWRPSVPPAGGDVGATP